MLLWVDFAIRRRESWPWEDAQGPVRGLFLVSEGLALGKLVGVALWLAGGWAFLACDFSCAPQLSYSRPASYLWQPTFVHSYLSSINWSDGQLDYSIDSWSVRFVLQYLFHAESNDTGIGKLPRRLEHLCSGN